MIAARPVVHVSAPVPPRRPRPQRRGRSRRVAESAVRRTEAPHPGTPPARPASCPSVDRRLQSLSAGVAQYGRHRPRRLRAGHTSNRPANATADREHSAPQRLLRAGAALVRTVQQPGRNQVHRFSRTSGNAADCPTPLGKVSRQGPHHHEEEKCLLIVVQVDGELVRIRLTWTQFRAVEHESQYDPTMDRVQLGS